MYTIILQNRSGILTKLNHAIGHVLPSDLIIVEPQSAPLLSKLSSTDTECNEIDTLEFNITLSVEEWKCIHIFTYPSL